MVPYRLLIFSYVVTAGSCHGVSISDNNRNNERCLTHVQEWRKGVTEGRSIVSYKTQLESHIFDFRLYLFPHCNFTTTLSLMFHLLIRLHVRLDGKKPWVIRERILVQVKTLLTVGPNNLKPGPPHGRLLSPYWYEKRRFRHWCRFYRNLEPCEPKYRVKVVNTRETSVRRMTWRKSKLKEVTVHSYTHGSVSPTTFQYIFIFNISPET